MKFNMTDIVSKDQPVEVEVPAYLTNPGEWSVIYNAIMMAQNGRRGTAAKQILGAIERIRKEAMEDSVQGRVEAYIVGHRDGWGEACEVEEDFKPPAAGIGFVVKHTPVADARRPWSDMTDEEKMAFRRGVANHIDLAVKVHNEHWRPGVTAVAKEVIDGQQS